MGNTVVPLLATGIALAALLGAPPARAQTAPVTVGVDAGAGRHAISPLIYGVAFGSEAALADLSSPLNRYGGNATSRYNWQLNADNRANDWYYESIGDDSAVAGECAPVTSVPPATSAAIATTLADIKDRHRLGAVIFGAEQDGRPLVRTALGVSTDGVPATTAMHFRIGGVGWQYLATVLLRMTEQQPGAIALADPVAKWYAGYPHADRATVRMLAASSAGFGDYIVPASFTDDVEADPLRFWSADDLLARSVAPYAAPRFDAPGRYWAYSHTDFVMLGAILEKASGRKYADLLRELVIDPLGLRDTRLQFDAAPQLPVLHTLQEGDFRDSTFWNPSFVSWAALTSNICDLGAWNRAFGTGSLLSPATRGETTAPVNVGLPFPPPNPASRVVTDQAYFGLGTLVYPPWIVQRAAYWGMYTTTAYDTSTGLSLAVTISLTRESPAGIQPSDEIVTEISRILAPGHPVPR